MAKRKLTPQQRAISKAKAALGEHFDAAVIIVPVTLDGESHVCVESVGHASFSKGLLEDAYNKMFEDEPEWPSSDAGDAEDPDDGAATG